MSDSIESVRASVINHELERENADLQAQLEAVRAIAFHDEIDDWKWKVQKIRAAIGEVKS